MIVSVSRRNIKTPFLIFESSFVPLLVPLRFVLPSDHLPRSRIVPVIPGPAFWFLAVGVSWLYTVSIKRELVD
jgi:hypothetical protein